MIDRSARLITDRLPGHRRIPGTVAENITVDHVWQPFSDGAGAYVVTTGLLAIRAAESLSIGLLKRSFQFIWHSAPRQRLDAYTTKCTWRHNRCEVPAATKFIQALADLTGSTLGHRERVACG